MNLYDLTVKTALIIDTFRHASIGDWVETIDPVLKAAGLSTIGSDSVYEITIKRDEIIIHTNYTVRMCAQSDEIHIPIFILKAKDPVYEAKQYRIVKAVAKASEQLQIAQKDVDRKTAEIAALTTELKALHESEFAK